MELLHVPSDVIEIMWRECPFGGDIFSSTINSLRKLGLLHLISHWIHIPRAGQVPDLCRERSVHNSEGVRGDLHHWGSGARDR